MGIKFDVEITLAKLPVTRRNYLWLYMKCSHYITFHKLSGYQETKINTPVEQLCHRNIIFIFVALGAKKFFKFKNSQKPTTVLVSL